MIDDYLALIPAAGVGARAQLSTAKQFLKIGEKTILEHAIDPFIKDENCKKICKRLLGWKYKIWLWRL